MRVYSESFFGAITWIGIVKLLYYSRETILLIRVEGSLSTPKLYVYSMIFLYHLYIGIPLFFTCVNTTPLQITPKESITNTAPRPYHQLFTSAYQPLEPPGMYLSLQNLRRPLPSSLSLFLYHPNLPNLRLEILVFSPSLDFVVTSIKRN